VVTNNQELEQGILSIAKKDTKPRSKSNIEHCLAKYQLANKKPRGS